MRLEATLMPFIKSCAANPHGIGRKKNNRNYSGAFHLFIYLISTKYD